MTSLSQVRSGTGIGPPITFDSGRRGARGMLAAPSGVTTSPPHPAIAQAGTEAVAVTPSATDRSAIGVAYQRLSGFTDCPVIPLPGRLKVAVITASRVEWAVGPTVQGH